jgi:MerR family transcriptional regulator/heat shock protein HspR
MQDPIDIYEPILTIGTVAEKLGIAVQTIRMYEKEGLVLPHKTASGRRMYSMHELERLRCIRKMITEHKLNLNGIKRLMSLIPCWEFKGGLDEECKNCPAYYEAHGPCWDIKNVGSKCKAEDCRDCPVYRVEVNCNKIKEVIFGHHRHDDSVTK